MRPVLRRFTPALLLFGSGLLAAAQTVPILPDLPATAPTVVRPAAVEASGDIHLLLQFRESDVKFRLADLMDVLRDRRHEGWVLAAYPDPKTGQPLIGAGFSLDLRERPHPQTDPLNLHPFVEPSSAQLWQAAGLDPARLDVILADYNERLADWKMKRFRRRIGQLEPQITEADANALLRIAAIQAIVNARAYCRTFDDLTASQQMAMTQLVYQMGVNLSEFSNFLRLVNEDGADWRAVQASLEQSQWARLYRVRAVAVIAMLDPTYADGPSVAERRVAAVLHPARRHGRHAARMESASWRRHRTGHAGRRHAAARRRKKV
ncbi:MAG TPA: hypothetical protein VJV22_17665 [Acidobacteriaceae bacterium]|nr:hypothetical protein [Acidobacteriaceae bacterium]